MANMRIILCANSTSKLIAPIKSRCLLIRVAAPSGSEASIHSPRLMTRRSTFLRWQMDAALRYVAKKEKFDLPDTAAAEIIKDARGNLRKALLVLEALKMQS
jgi:replication factor C subunit 3/5